MTVTALGMIDMLNTIIDESYQDEGFYTLVSVRTPNEQRYDNMLGLLGYEGDINRTPDRNGNVATLFRSDDGLVGVSVFWQGPKPEKPESETDSEPSEAESDLDTE